MPERVTVQLEPPTPWSSGSVTEGFYVVEGDTLKMTFASGEPVKVDGKPVERILAPGEDARKIAGRLTREVRRALSGRTAVQEVFAREIAYPPGQF